MSSGGGNCVVCDRKIFSSQLSELDGNRYHHGCIKCAKCNVTLEPRKVKYNEDGDIVCRRHADGGPKLKVTVGSKRVRKLSVSQADAPPPAAAAAAETVATTAAAAPAAAVESPEAPRVLVEGDEGYIPPNCKACLDPVYDTQRLDVDEHVFHVACFRCQKCFENLTPRNYKIDGESQKLFCQPHWDELQNVGKVSLAEAAEVFGTENEEDRRLFAQAEDKKAKIREQIEAARAEAGGGGFEASKRRRETALAMAKSKERCTVCSKRVYTSEKYELSEFRDGQNVSTLFHRACFRCNVCKKTLNKDSFKKDLRTGPYLIFCERHYGRWLRDFEAGKIPIQEPAATASGAAAADADAADADGDAGEAGAGEEAGDGLTEAERKRQREAERIARVREERARKEAEDKAREEAEAQAALDRLKANREAARKAREQKEAREKAEAAAAAAALAAVQAETDAAAAAAAEVAAAVVEVDGTTVEVSLTDQERCEKCTKRVYSGEEARVSGNLYHKACFRCEKCNKTLKPKNAKNFGITDDHRLFCKLHYRKFLRGTLDQEVSLSARLASRDSATPRTSRRQETMPTSVKDRLNLYKKEAATVDKKHEEAQARMVERRRTVGQRVVKENADLSTRVAKLDEAYVEQDKRHEEFAEQQVKARDAHTEEGREAIKDLGQELKLDPSMMGGGIRAPPPGSLEALTEAGVIPSDASAAAASTAVAAGGGMAGGAGLSPEEVLASRLTQVKIEHVEEDPSMLRGVTRARPTGPSTRRPRTRPGRRNRGEAADDDGGDDGGDGGADA